MKQILFLFFILFSTSAFAADGLIDTIPDMYRGTYIARQASDNAGKTYASCDVAMCNLKSNYMTLGIGKTIIFKRIALKTVDGTEYLLVQSPNGMVWAIAYMGDSVGYWFLQCLNEDGTETSRFICEKSN